MLLNLAFETSRRLRLRGRLLARRARGASERVPVILVPSVLGVRLRGAWTGTLDLYRSRPLSGGGAPLGLLRGFPIVPGLWSYDCYGGLVRFLVRTGGYRLGEDLHLLDYDWRTGVVDAAAALDELVTRLRGAGDEKLDLIGVSTGGLVARTAMATAGADRFRRVVYIGVPQRGSLHVVEMLATGVRPAPLGRRFSPADVAALPVSWDGLPRAGERLFVDEHGAPLEHDILDPATWKRLGMCELPERDIADRLAGVARLHALLDGAPAHPDAIAIGGRNLPTAVRAKVVDGRVAFPPCDVRRDEPLKDTLYAPGDGSVPASSVSALPGLGGERTWWVKPAAHHLLPAHPEVHRLVLEALLAPAPSATAPDPVRIRRRPEPVSAVGPAATPST